ncbi:hypothetical protein [Ralstonia chuxiongensis]|uniref:hypothetical protein n=1 Tax=Ralstonia chuxiongensis TaxID=2957504 RepID=UPI0028F57742|nr:hypothetical protein [Ralstonia chuxiongensis]CAJ0769849.1 hypothetical protein R8510_00003 [Ralstonia chuxiongensis]
MNLTALFLGMSLSLAGCAGTMTSAQSQASFDAAIENHSTSPSYVKITVVDATTGTSQSTCTTANLLLGAIHLEHDIPFGQSGGADAERLALSNSGHTFRFTKHSAVANIPVAFTDADLAFVRDKLKGLSEAELRDGFSVHGKLHSIYMRLPLKQGYAYRDAIACVLIEHGLSPRMADITGQIRIAQ